MPRRWTPSIVPSGDDKDVYLVLDDFGRLGRVYREAEIERADLESVHFRPDVRAIQRPGCVVAFNTAENWAVDASEDIAREIMRRLDLDGDELPSSPEAFVDRHLGPDRRPGLRDLNHEV